jgi:release factor glutamine methyltransferase
VHPGETVTTEVRGLLADATRRLAGVGIGSARVDAELLLAALLDVPRTRPLTLAAVPAPVAAQYEQEVARRATREPLQHITGHAPFRNLVLAVGPGVFVPRPETELLVDAALPELTARDEPVVVDLCAGSGALALAIADEASNARVVAVEKSPVAIHWLRRNATGTRVQIVTGDIGDRELLRAWSGRVDVVVSNPPYVPAATLVDPEVRADPAEAVFAGVDGLDLIPTVISCAARLLRPGGFVALEHDDTQGEAVPSLLRADGHFIDVADHLDLSGRARFATARRFAGHR